LTPGPLRLIADEARQNPTKPYLLIVDEINRGNIAKIFGELYFLLEYRDQPAALQYSPQEEFTLPRNLFFIGTMNTADRSIALVDSALRRRFYFVPFLPTESPLRDVLGLWLKERKLDPEPAIMLHRLNEAIGATEFSIGPAYFMAGKDGVDLNRIWRYAIRPLLEEHYYGTGRKIDEFSFEALRKTGSDVFIEEQPEEGELE
jgi:5-methylcytosine-specific restriction protein B